MRMRLVAPSFLRSGKVFAVRHRSGLGLALACLGALFLGASNARAAGPCALSPDEHNPSLNVLHCANDALVVREAEGTQFVTVPPQGAPPRAIALQSGAVLVQFHATAKVKDFEILTPIAIAAVRGTQWAVEFAPDKMSTFVVSGRVLVRRPHARHAVALLAGDGVDVTPDGAPLVVKRWAQPRVQALMARFGQ
jgi:hypothetical protein